MKRWLVAVALFVAASVVLELPFRHLIHSELPWHLVPGFDFVYGFLGCAVIVLASKWLGHALLQRPEDYYDREPDGR
jgi:hypothetical protein